MPGQGRPRNRNRNTSQSNDQRDPNTEMDVKEDIREIKNALSDMNEAIKEVNYGVKENKKTVSDLLKSIEELQNRLKEKDKRIELLEDKINEFEQYSKKNNIIISGESLNLHSYSQAAENEDLGNERSSPETLVPEEDDSMSTLNEGIMKTNFIKFAESKLSVSIKDDQIVAIHKLKKRRDGITPIIIKFTSNAAKFQIMKSRRKLKGQKIFINDHLTQRNTALERKARQLKKEKRIDSSWTWNGRIFIKETETSMKREIKHQKDLDMFN